MFSFLNKKQYIAVIYLHQKPVKKILYYTVIIFTVINSNFTRLYWQLFCQVFTVKSTVKFVTVQCSILYIYFLIYGSVPQQSSIQTTSHLPINTAHPWVLRNTPANVLLHTVSSSQDNQATDTHTHTQKHTDFCLHSQRSLERIVWDGLLVLAGHCFKLQHVHTHRHTQTHIHFGCILYLQIELRSNLHDKSLSLQIGRAHV